MAFFSGSPMPVDNPTPRDGPPRSLRLRRSLRIPSHRAKALTAALVAALAADASAGLPPENRCPIVSGRVPGKARDAAPMPLREGMVLKAADLLRISTLLPDEVWANRDAFFYEGMRMEIGPCHRRYRVPAHFSDATERFAARDRSLATRLAVSLVFALVFGSRNTMPGFTLKLCSVK